MRGHRFLHRALDRGHVGEPPDLPVPLDEPAVALRVERRAVGDEIALGMRHPLVGGVPVGELARPLQDVVERPVGLEVDVARRRVSDGQAGDGPRIPQRVVDRDRDAHRVAEQHEGVIAGGSDHGLQITREVSRGETGARRIGEAGAPSGYPKDTAGLGADARAAVDLRAARVPGAAGHEHERQPLRRRVRVRGPLQRLDPNSPVVAPDRPRLAHAGMMDPRRRAASVRPVATAPRPTAPRRRSRRPDPSG